MAVRRWHVAVVNAVLVVAAAYLAGRLAGAAVRVVWPSPENPTSRAAPTSPAPGSLWTAPERSSYDVVVARDLFRTAPPRPDAASHLRLVGVAAHLPSRFAVIEDTRRGVQRLYRLGERVGGAADETPPLTVARIELDRVVLELDGGTYVLARAERGGGRRVGEVRQAERKRPAETSDAAIVAASRVPGAERPLVRRGRDDEYLLDRRAFEAAVGDVDRVAAQIRVIPNVVDGKATGYRVFGIGASSVFSHLGLRNGDVLRSVNAVALTDPQTALGVLRDLPRERRITLDIYRRQHPQTLTYEIR
jgi:general secretion pathway protein C